MPEPADPKSLTLSLAPPSLTVPEGGGRFYFLVIRASSASLYHLPEDGTLVAGRAPEANLRVTDHSASRQHARFVITRGHVRVQDLGSRNCTWVNGEPIAQERSIVSGDVVTIGTLTLVLHQPVTSPGPAPAGPPPELIRLRIGEKTIYLADPAMLRLYELLRRLAQSPLPVLVSGETGTGKENAALAVHHFSGRSKGPFVSVNCAAIPESLVESELFGHEKGAFSGAIKSHVGRLEAAHGGTLFLDELGELPLAAQAKLLRAVESSVVTPVGATREKTLDLRIVAATNRDLEQEVAAGRFRQDLFFRISVATVTLPPLRERRSELALLAETFLLDACTRAGRPLLRLDPETLALLLQHSFPGNVRELKNLMDYGAAVAPPQATFLLPEQLPGRLGSKRSEAGDQSAQPLVNQPATPGAPTPTPRPTPPSSGGGPADPPAFRNLAEEVEALEKQRMQEALVASSGHQKKAAQLIGMPLRTFVTKLKQYGLRD